MYLLIFILFLIIPAVLGTAEILHYFKLALLSSKDKSRKFNCIFLDEENAVMRLKVFAEENSWNGIRDGKKSFAVYENISKETLEECVNIAKKNDIELLNSEEFYIRIKDF